MDIIWKDVKGYEGLYEVSNTGYIKSLQFKKPFIKKFNKNTSKKSTHKKEYKKKTTVKS